MGKSSQGPHSSKPHFCSDDFVPVFCLTTGTFLYCLLHSDNKGELNEVPVRLDSICPSFFFFYQPKKHFPPETGSSHIYNLLAATSGKSVGNIQPLSRTV